LFLTMKRKYYPCTIFGYYNMVYLTRIWYVLTKFSYLFKCNLLYNMIGLNIFF
jgi:hypothetical protein